MTKLRLYEVEQGSWIPESVDGGAVSRNSSVPSRRINTAPIQVILGSYSVVSWLCDLGIFTYSVLQL